MPPSIHTDRLNESGFVETTLKAIGGRTIHFTPITPKPPAAGTHPTSSRRVASVAINARDLELAWRENLFGPMRMRLALQRGIDGTGCQCSFDPFLSRVNLADTLHEKTRRHVLQDDAARAHANGSYHFVIVRCRQDNDVRSQRITFHFAQHRQAILSGHAQIEHKDV